MEKPEAAFILSLIAGIFILISAIITAVFTTLLGGIISFIPIVGSVGLLVIIVGVVGVVFGALVLVGAFMINSEDPSRVRTGSILVLVFSILSIMTGGGFIIGLILGIVGAVLALVWKPQQRPS
jgi:hypothetical protein